MLEPLCREYEVSIELGAVPLGATIWAPKGSLQQVLYNLIVNAIQASPVGGCVNISVNYADTGLGEILIHDEGRGIPRELQDRVFKPFVSADSTDSARPGLGLGLSIVKSILDSVGGKIAFESSVNKGTCFRVYLPSHQP